MLFVCFAAVGAEDSENKKAEGNVSPTTEESPKKNLGKSIDSKKMKINTIYVDKTVKDLTNRLKEDAKGSGEAYSTELSIFASKLQLIGKYPDIELETGTYRKWYILLYNTVEGLSKARRAEKTAKLMNNGNASVQAVAAYKKGISDYRTILKNKAKYQIPDDKLREMQKKKEEAERKAKRR